MSEDHIKTYNENAKRHNKRVRRVTMNEKDFFKALQNLVKDTNVDYSQEFVGDEEQDEIYVKFKGIKEVEDEILR